jgi:hypothetical protein
MSRIITERRVVEVSAGISWPATLLHRVYSCPDTPTHNFVFGATFLLLKNGQTGPRVFLNVKTVETCDPHAPDFPDTVPAKFRARLNSYKDAVQNIPGILNNGGDYRFYFLSEEPWPDRLQALTTPEQCPDMEWIAILSVCAEPSRFFEWPQVGTLLWPGCVRAAEDHQYAYPAELTNRLARLGLRPDPRNNGPAILAFLAAGGNRPTWESEGWPIHHIYDGTGAMDDVPQNVLRAVRHGQHFTHSAGLVAAHPVAHHLAHQSDLLKWLLRREAFLRFGYDPMGVFS